MHLHIHRIKVSRWAACLVQNVHTQRYTTQAAIDSRTYVREPLRAVTRSVVQWGVDPSCRAPRARAPTCFVFGEGELWLWLWGYRFAMELPSLKLSDASLLYSFIKGNIASNALTLCIFIKSIKH